MKRKKQNKSKLEEAVYISWEESEAGWGQRPDGFSLHLTKSDYNSFLEDYWARMPKNYVPREYSRPTGSPSKVLVSQNLYKQIKETKNGLRRSDEREYVKKGDLKFISERSGWVVIK